MRRSVLIATLLMLSACDAAQKRAELETAYVTTQAEKSGLTTALTREVSENVEIEAWMMGMATDLEELKRALAALRKSEAEAEARAEEYRALIAQFQDMIDAGNLSVKLTDGRLVVQMPSDILFGSGSAILSEPGIAQLKEVAQVLSGLDHDFQVEGHTDSDAMNTARFPDNWALSAGRAAAVLGELETAGVPLSRLNIAGFADTRPTADNSTDEGKAENRRIEIVLIPDLSAIPDIEGLEDGTGPIVEKP